MALSNWDLLVLDHDGRPCDGSFTSPEGVEVEFYKNWLYVRDPKGWTHGAFVEPTVMQVTEGILRYKDVAIVAFRGPQDGVYAVVWRTDYPKQEQGARPLPAVITGMVGCGVYGYDGDRWVGVQPKSLRFLEHELNVKHAHSSRVPEWQRGEYVRNVPDVFRSLPFDSAERTNQGDAYLASALGFAAPSSRPGQSDEPVLMQMLAMPEKT